MYFGWVVVVVGYVEECGVGVGWLDGVGCCGWFWFYDFG